MRLDASMRLDRQLGRCIGSDLLRRLQDGGANFSQVASFLLLPEEKGSSDLL